MSVNHTNKLHDLSSAMLKTSINYISSFAHEKYYPVAKFYIKETEGFHDSAWLLIKENKYNESIAVSRVILESAIDLFWVISGNENKEERMNFLFLTALKNEKRYLNGFITLLDKPDKFVDKLNDLEPTLHLIKTKQTYNSFTARSNEYSRSNRAQDIMGRDSLNLENNKLYNLYRICCSSAHSNSNLWRRFAENNAGVKEFNSEDEKELLALWVVVLSTFYVCVSSYKLIDIANISELEKYFKEDICPIIKDLDESHA